MFKISSTSQLPNHRSFVMNLCSRQSPKHSVDQIPLYRPALVTDRSYKYRSQGTVRWAPPFGARAALGSGIYVSYNPMAAGLYPLTPVITRTSSRQNRPLTLEPFPYLLV